MSCRVVAGPGAAGGQQIVDVCRFLLLKKTVTDYGTDLGSDRFMVGSIYGRIELWSDRITVPIYGQGFPQ